MRKIIVWVGSLLLATACTTTSSTDDDDGTPTQVSSSSSAGTVSGSGSSSAVSTASTGVPSSTSIAPVSSSSSRSSSSGAHTSTSSAPVQNANEMGINIGGPLDWEGVRLYADVMRMARDFEKPQGGAATVDSRGWPTEDFKVVVWHGIPSMHGTYTLSFEGQAQQVQAGWADITVSTPVYDAASNTSTATLVYRNTDGAGMELRMTGTKRTAQSNSGTGVTNIKLMRPISPGSTQSHDPGTLFHGPLKELIKKFTAVRFMDFLATNNNQQLTWSDRMLPTWASYNRSKEGYGWQGMGGPWEHVVMLANELDVDPWINIPAKVDEDYVRKVAQLFRFGSDGLNPYSAPQDHPVFPPLKSNLHLYVEYSNELWNGAGAFSVQFNYNHEQAQAEVGRGDSPLDFDGESGTWQWAWRRIAKRGAEISLIFREVFGDAAMMTQVRPVLMTQQDDGQGTLFQALKLLHGYYNNGEGDFVQDPHPPSYYFHGAGGSGYYNPDNGSGSLSLDTIWDSETMDSANWAGSLRTDADRVAALGLLRMCYEGGPSLDRSGHSENIKEASVRDDRMTQEILEHHQAWSSFGGRLFMYFTAVSDYQWGFTEDVYDLDTPKLRGIDALNTAERTAINHGTAVPGSVDGNAFGVSNRGWDSPGTGSREFRQGMDQFQWASYSFRASSSSSRSITLRVSGAQSNAQVTVYWDGAKVETMSVPTGDGQQVAIGSVNVTPGLHGLIVRAVASRFRVDSVQVQ